MAELVLTVDIDAPPEVVFDALTDWTNQGEWMAGISTVFLSADWSSSTSTPFRSPRRTTIRWRRRCAFPSPALRSHGIGGRQPVDMRYIGRTPPRFISSYMRISLRLITRLRIVGQAPLGQASERRTQIQERPCNQR